MLAVMGFLIIIAMIYLLFNAKTIPVVPFVLLPIAGAFLAGANMDQIAEYINYGVSQTWKTAVLFIFSVTYFGIMTDVGLFDKMINRLIGFAGNNIVILFIATVLIATIAHLDGSGATTFLITIPALLPIYKKLGLKPTSLLLLIAASAGVMNLVPWGGSTLRAATVLGVDATEIWKSMIPIQIFGLLLALTLAVILAKIESKRRLAPLDIDTLDKAQDQAGIQALKRPKLLWFNLLLTLGLITLLLTVSAIPAFAVFMFGVAVALPVNYPNANLQTERIKAHAPAAMLMAIILLSAGVLLGIMSKSGMIDAMAGSIITLLPAALASHLHILVALLTAPIHLVIGTDPYYYGLMPTIMSVTEQYGVPAKQVAMAMLIGENITFAISAVVPSVYLATGLAGVDYKAHLKYSLLWIWGMSVLMLLFAIAIGIIQV